MNILTFRKENSEDNEEDRLERKKIPKTKRRLRERSEQRQWCSRRWKRFQNIEKVKVIVSEINCTWGCERGGNWGRFEGSNLGNQSMNTPLAATVWKFLEKQFIIVQRLLETNPKITSYYPQTKLWEGIWSNFDFSTLRKTLTNLENMQRIASKGLKGIEETLGQTENWDLSLHMINSYKSHKG